MKPANASGNGSQGLQIAGLSG
jgi:hypothetical protein